MKDWIIITQVYYLMRNIPGITFKIVSIYILTKYNNNYNKYTTVLIRNNNNNNFKIKKPIINNLFCYEP